MKYIKHFSNLPEQTAYLAEADIDTYLGYVDENDTVYYDDVIPERYDDKYFTIESTSDNNTIYWVTSDDGDSWIISISASTDNGETWVEYTSTNEGAAIATLNTGDKILLKGYGADGGYASSSWHCHFNSTGQFIVYGNIMSLANGDSFINVKTLPISNTFAYLFENCIGLTSAENLVLPATTLKEACYRNMFYGCTSLTVAPELPATTLALGCYYYMFQGCASLNYIKCLATNISSSGYTNYWVSGVASTGTFVKNAAMTSWTTGANGIPSGWTVQNA